MISLHLNKEKCINYRDKESYRCASLSYETKLDETSDQPSLAEGGVRRASSFFFLLRSD